MLGLVEQLVIVMTKPKDPVSESDWVYVQLEDSKCAKNDKKTTSKWLKKAPNVSICSLTQVQADGQWRKSTDLTLT